MSHSASTTHLLVRMVLLALFFFCWVPKIDGRALFYFPNYGIIPREECIRQESDFGQDLVNSNVTSYYRSTCPRFHDGLACWDSLTALQQMPSSGNYSDVLYEKNYETVELFCPTVSRQLTTKVMRKYCGENGEWVDPKAEDTSNQDYIEDSECYPAGVRPTADERRKLNKLTTKLNNLFYQCVFNSNERDVPWVQKALKFMVEESPTLMQERQLRFDGIACYYVDDNQENRVQSFDPQLNCPIDAEFFNPVSISLNSTTNEQQYGSGWTYCLREEYKTLLTKLGLDKYFQQGCAAFEDELISLPQTKFATKAYSPCDRPLQSQLIDKRELESGRYDPRGQAAFLCNNFGMWEGDRNIFKNKGCLSESFKRVLNDMSAEESVCPAMSDDIFGQWPVTQRGKNATLPCTNVLKLFGYPTEKQPGTYYSNLKDTFPDISRLCDEQGKWAKIDWLQCIPKGDRTSVAQDAQKYRDN